MKKNREFIRGNTKRLMVHRKVLHAFFCFWRTLNRSAVANERNFGWIWFLSCDLNQMQSFAINFPLLTNGPECPQSKKVNVFFCWLWWKYIELIGNRRVFIRFWFLSNTDKTLTLSWARKVTTMKSVWHSCKLYNTHIAGIRHQLLASKTCTHNHVTSKVCYNENQRLWAEKKNKKNKLHRNQPKRTYQSMWFELSERMTYIFKFIDCAYVCVCIISKQWNCKILSWFTEIWSSSP